MTRASLRAFEDPEAHQAIASIIRRRSTHPEDVREVLLRGLDLSFARDILDLGCGFGFMAEAIAPRAAADARFLGVDACPANAAPFLRHITKAARSGEGRSPSAQFSVLAIDSTLPWTDASFDLVVCSYSLYFFPDVLPEIARVLRPGGMLLALTHSARSFVEMLRAAGLDAESSPLTALVSRFSAEDAPVRLAGHFAEVERVEYPNYLRFGPEEIGDAVTYLCFKLPLLCAPVRPEEGGMAEVAASIAEWVRTRGELLVTKDDAGFRCRGPRRGSP